MQQRGSNASPLPLEALPRAARTEDHPCTPVGGGRIEARDAANAPPKGPGGLPALNTNLAANLGTSYPITSTPRKELW